MILDRNTKYLSKSLSVKSSIIPFLHLKNLNPSISQSTHPSIYSFILTSESSGYQYELRLLPLAPAPVALSLNLSFLSSTFSFLSSPFVAFLELLCLTGYFWKCKHDKFVIDDHKFYNFTQFWLSINLLFFVISFTFISGA